MANALYSKAKEQFLGGNLNLSANTVKIVLVDSEEYTFSAAHTGLDDIPGGGRISTATLSGKAITNGIFDATDAVFSNVTGDQSEALVIYHELTVGGTVDANNSTLIAYIDTATGLPITPSGGDITVAFSDGANKIFAL